jgi:hypothetical protein
MKQQFVAKNKSTSEPVKWDITSNVIQLTAVKTGAEKQDFRKNSTQCML